MVTIGSRCYRANFQANLSLQMRLTLLTNQHTDKIPNVRRLRWIADFCFAQKNTHRVCQRFAVHVMQVRYQVTQWRVRLHLALCTNWSSCAHLPDVISLPPILLSRCIYIQSFICHIHTHTSTRALVVKSRSVNGWPWFYVRVKFWIEKCYDF